MALPPGAAGYLAGEQSVLQGSQAQLGQLATLMQLEDRRQAALKDMAFRQDLSALGPNPDQGALAQLAIKYASPQDVLRTQQSSLDRQATIEANREAARARVEQAAQNAQMLHEARMANIKTAEERTAEVARHNRVLEGLRQEMINSRPKPQGTIIQTAEGVFERTPEGLKRLTDPTTGEPLKPKVGEKPITEYQGKNALYGQRALMADKVLNDLEGQINQVGLATKQGIQSTPLIGGIAGVAANTLLSANQQSVEQAQRNFVNAVLRQESGAVISDAEFENAKKQYFQQPGDTPKVVAQKRANRQAAIAGFKRIAGPAWQDVEATTPAAPPDANNPGWSIKPLP